MIKKKTIFLKRSVLCYLRYHISNRLNININPFLAIINLTTKCNFNCKFCRKIKQKIDLSIPSFNIILREIYKLRVPYITFSGG